MCPLALAVVLTGSAASAQTFKVAYWNIKSGKGQIALPGYPATFVDTSNCTDPTQPMNAWGAGIVPLELARLNADPGIVALGLGEAWVCGGHQRVKAALGWAASVPDQNGVSIVARYGFAGPVQWKQLDTSKAVTPSDTMWVLRARVCLDAACSDSIEVFTAHWGGGGANVMDVQAQETVTFLSAVPAGEPHILIGDLNVFETSTPCAATPLFTPLAFLRGANYTDAWNYLNGSATGYTGMTNRAGCGSPPGSTFKRIDYSWSKNILPVSMQRFGMVPPGTEAPSDHYGIIVEYPRPNSGAPPDTAPPVASISSPAPNTSVGGTGSVSISASDNRAVVRVEVLLDGALLGTTTAAPYQVAWDTTPSANGSHSLRAVAYDAAGNAGTSTAISVNVYNAPPPPPPGPAPAEIVVHAAHATAIAGAWRSVADATAASGARLWHPNANAAKLTVPLASPANYFEVTFQAQAGVPYRLWMRGIAEANYWGNDSVFVQFSGSVTASGTPIDRIGTTAATSYVLEDCSGCGVSGWGWQDNGYGIGVLGPLVYFAQSGAQTMRVQGREDGISIDQIVLSPQLYLTSAPGAVRNDTTIVPEPAAPPPPPPTGAFTWGAILNSTASPGGLVKTSGCNGCAAGGLSIETLTSGGFVEFTPSAGHRLYGGLGRPDAAPGSNDIAFSFSFWPDGGWDIRERNTYRAEGTFAAGDRFRVAIDNGVVKYYKNATLVYTSTVAPASPMSLNVSLLTPNASVANAVLQLP